MPIEIKSLEELEKISQKGIECRVKRNNKDGRAKIKVRTNKYLYTYVVSKDKVDEILTKLNCKNLVDLDKQKPKAQKPKKAKEEKKQEKKEEAKEEAKPKEEKNEEETKQSVSETSEKEASTSEEESISEENQESEKEPENKS